MTDTEQQQAPSAPEEESSPFDGLKDAAKGLRKTILDFGFSKASGLTENLGSKLTSFATGKQGEDEGGSGPGPMAGAVTNAVEAKVKGENPATAAIKGALGGVKNKLTGGGSKGGKNKFVNIVEWIDVGVPVRVAYNQWTEFERWSSFMKKLENAQRNEGAGKVAFKAQVFLSPRSWESSIVEMVPDDHIVGQWTGQKGSRSGGITFQEVGTPPLTRMCVVVEYHPQGVIEKTLQIWRSVGRAVRRELKRYVRQVQTSTILDQDNVEGWRAEIREKKIVRTHDEVVEQEQREAEEAEAREAEAADQEGDEAEAPAGADADADGTETEPGSDEDEADAAEDATYLDEAGVGQGGEQAGGEGEPGDEDSTDEDEADEDATDEYGDEPEDSDEDESDEDESDEDAEGDEYDEETPQDADDSEAEDEDEDEPEDSDDTEAGDESDEYESEGDDSEYEDEDEDESEGEGDGADDEYEDEEPEGN